MKRRDFGVLSGLGSLGLTAHRPAMGQSQGATAIQGAWSMEVKHQHPPPGVTDFSSLITYAAGGVTVEANGAPGFGPATGVWEFVRAGAFAATWLKPIYNVHSGSFAGTVKIRGRIQMSGADTYESHDRLEFFTPDGTLAGSWTAIATAKRIQVE